LHELLEIKNAKIVMENETVQGALELGSDGKMSDAENIALA